MAADPFRLRVLKALNAALEEITPANGYTFDLSGRVYRGRDIFGNDEEPPFVAILEAIEQDENIPSPQAGGTIKGPWTLQIQGFAPDDRDHPTDPAHALMADVKKRLIQERLRERQYNILDMEGKVVEMRISQGVVRPADEVSSVAYFWLRMTLTVVENLLDPYD